MKKMRYSNCFIYCVLLMAALIRCSSQGEKSKPVRLRIATYNVHFFKTGTEHIDETIHRIQPHILAMQEVLLQDNTNFAETIALKYNYYHASSSPYVVHGKRKWVLTILSKFPVKRVSQIRLGKRRLGLRVDLHINNKAVCVATTHLSPYIWNDKNLIKVNLKRARERAEELEQLVRWLEPETGPVFLLGDLNEIPRSESLKILSKYGYRDADRSVFRQKLGTFPLKPRLVDRLKNHLPDFMVPDIITLDYIFYRGQVRIDNTRTVRSDASDHYPLVTDLTL